MQLSVAMLNIKKNGPYSSVKSSVVLAEIAIRRSLPYLTQASVLQNDLLDIPILLFRYVQKCTLMRCKLFIINITKCPHISKFTKTHMILSDMK